MKPLKLRYLIAIGVVLFFAITSPGAEVNWRTDYKAARKECSDTGRPLLAYFVSDNCLPCSQMNTVLESCASQINSTCVPYRCHVGSAPCASLAERTGVRLFPTTILAKPDGTIVKELIGLQHAAALSGAIETAFPTQKTEPTAVANVAMPTGGLDPTQLPKSETFYLGEHTIPGGQLQGPDSTVPDLGALPFVTVFSRNPARRASIADAIRSAPYGPRFRVTDMAPDHWQAKGFKLADDAKFKDADLKIIVQNPPAKPGEFGKETDAVYEWTNAEALGKRIDPLYNPNKTPASSGASNAPILVGGFGLLALLLLFPSKPEPEVVTDGP